MLLGRRNKKLLVFIEMEFLLIWNQEDDTCLHHQVSHSDLKETGPSITCLTSVGYCCIKNHPQIQLKTVSISYAYGLHISWVTLLVLDFGELAQGRSPHLVQLSLLEVVCEWKGRGSEVKRTEFKSLLTLPGCVTLSELNKSCERHFSGCKTGLLGRFSATQCP